jgi:formylmethanofuran dehydrogenase subunit E
MSEKEYEYNYDDELDESEEERPIARCEECGELIDEDNKDAYIDDEGNYFCCLQCVLDYYYIKRVDENDKT